MNNLIYYYGQQQDFYEVLKTACQGKEIKVKIYLHVNNTPHFIEKQNQVSDKNQ